MLNSKPTNCSITTKMEYASGSEEKQLVCRPWIKYLKWLKKIVMNKNIYQFNLRTKTFTDVPYKLLNSWEEIFDEPTPRTMVYELTRKTTPDSKRHFLKCK
jgi:hypothetical protein